MPSPTNTLLTYHAGTQGVGLGNYEDLSNEFKLIKNADTIFYDELSKTKAEAKKVEWIVKSLRSGADNKQIEGEQFTFVNISTPVRNYNMIQALAIPFGISDQQDAVKSVEGNLSTKTADALELLKRDAEYAVINGVRNDGNASTPASMRGILNWITTNLNKATDATLNADGTVTGGTPRALTVDILKSAHQNAYSAGGAPDILYVPPIQADKLAGLTQTGNFRIPVEDGKVYDYVDVYKTPYGLLKVVIHRGLPSSVIVGIDKKFWDLPHLLPVRRKQLAENGFYKAYVVGVDFTVRAWNEASSFRITNLTTT